MTIGPKPYPDKQKVIASLKSVAQTLTSIFFSLGYCWFVLITLLIGTLLLFSPLGDDVLTAFQEKKGMAHYVVLVVATGWWIYSTWIAIQVRFFLLTEDQLKKLNLPEQWPRTATVMGASLVLLAVILALVLQPGLGMAGYLYILLLAFLGSLIIRILYHHLSLSLYEKTGAVERGDTFYKLLLQQQEKVTSQAYRMKLRKIFFITTGLFLLIGILFTWYPGWLETLAPNFVVVIFSLGCWNLLLAGVSVFFPKQWRFLVIVIAIVYSGIVNTSYDNNIVRRLEQPTAYDTAASLHDYLTVWTKERAIDTTSYFPLIIVSAEGGATRSAYWATQILSMLYADALFRKHLFAYSSVSGGTLGVAAFQSLITTPPSYVASDSLKITNALQQQSREFLQSDFLSLPLARYLFAELVYSFFPFRFYPSDRGAALEIAWEKSWDKVKEGTSNPLRRSFAASWNQDIRISDTLRPVIPPAHLINSTVVETGQRAILAPFSIEDKMFPGAVDVRRYFSPDSLAYSTAVLLSARFPYLSPAGATHQGKDATHFVDGGYFENSGALTARDLWRAIRQDPTYGTKASVLFINLHYDPQKADRTPAEMEEGKPWMDALLFDLFQLYAPAMTAFNSLFSHADWAIRELQEEVNLVRAQDSLQVIGQGTYRFTQSQRVPLNWQLSQAQFETIDQRADQDTVIISQVIEALKRHTHMVDSLQKQRRQQESPD